MKKSIYLLFILISIISCKKEKIIEGTIQTATLGRYAEFDNAILNMASAGEEIVLVVVDNEGLYKTENQGDDWELLTSLPTGDYSDIVCVSPSEFFVKVGYFIHRTVDGGTTWENLGAYTNVGQDGNGNVYLFSEEVGRIFLFNESGSYSTAWTYSSFDYCDHYEHMGDIIEVKIEGNYAFPLFKDFENDIYFHGAVDLMTGDYIDELEFTYHGIAADGEKCMFWVNYSNGASVFMANRFPDYSMGYDEIYFEEFIDTYPPVDETLFIASNLENGTGAIVGKYIYSNYRSGEFMPNQDLLKAYNRDLTLIKSEGFTAITRLNSELLLIAEDNNLLTLTF